MSPELDKKLCEKYPKIFADRHGDIRETLMPFGFSCSDGWYHIIDKLCSIIQHEIDWSIKNHEFDVEWNNMINSVLNNDLTLFEKRHKGYKQDYKDETLVKIRNGDISIKEVREIIPQVVAMQVKEKYGTLRFYTNHMTEKMYGAESMAEMMSAVTCEECGNSGKLRTGGWMRTLCDHHAVECGYDITEEKDEENVE